MDWTYFLKISVVRFFNILSWPSLTLLCPLLASIRAVESNMQSHYQLCLNYWVLFSMTSLLEYFFSKLIAWLPFWPSMKGMASLLLLIPSFAGASHVYTRVIRPFVFKDMSACYISFNQTTGARAADEQTKFLDASEQHKKVIQLEEMEKFVIHEGASESVEIVDNITTTASPRRVQNEWTCALCLISTSSEEDLGKHFSGKKHKAKEAEYRKNSVVMTNRTASDSSTTKSSMTLLGSLNKIRLVNLRGVINPKSIGWCIWTKPQVGWIKLNSDGSVCQENAGFGGLLRDFEGKPLCAYACKAHQDDVFFVELWAIWRGLVLALGLGIKMIWVESDAMAVVKTINKEQPYGPKAGSCLRHIWELLGKFAKFHVSHCWRESNKAADYLSKVNVSGSDVIILPVDFPQRLWKLVGDDAQGKWYCRG